MRLDSAPEVDGLWSVGIALTMAEARELRHALETLTEKGHPVGPGDHIHVPSADYQVEVTVWLDEDPPTAHRT